MSFELIFTDQASYSYDALEADKSQQARFKAVRKSLAYLETNPKHPGLKTHKFSSLSGPQGEEVLRRMHKTIHLAHTEYFGIMDLIKNKLLF